MLGMLVVGDGGMGMRPYAGGIEIIGGFVGAKNLSPVWELAVYRKNYEASKLFNIFLAKGSLISVCLGTASTTPVLGLIHSEWAFPSRFR